MKTLCWDFKANARSFPVVMADTGLHVQTTGTHTLSHTFLQAEPHPASTISFDGRVEPRRGRNKSFWKENIFEKAFVWSWQNRISISVAALGSSLMQCGCNARKKQMLTILRLLSIFLLLSPSRNWQYVTLQRINCHYRTFRQTNTC